MICLEEIYHNQHKLNFYYNDQSLKITTDSVLVADFVKFSNKDKLLVDFGTGLGTIPLFLSTRSNISMIGLEINREIADLAKKNIICNHLEEQITILNTKIQNASDYLSKNSVDIIVSNPPYFKVYDNSLLNITETKTLARHEVALKFVELVKEAHKLLREQGKLIIVHRVDRLIEILETLKKHNLEPKRIKIVYNSKDSNAVIFLLEAVKNGKSGLQIEAPLLLEERLYD